MHLSDSKNFVDTVCDANLFRQMMNFSEIVDLDQLQADLCQAATNNPQLVQQLITLVDLEYYWNMVKI